VPALYPKKYNIKLILYKFMTTQLCSKCINAVDYWIKSTSTSFKI